jgi:hypothetical protein
MKCGGKMKAGKGGRMGYAKGGAVSPRKAMAMKGSKGSKSSCK